LRLRVEEVWNVRRSWPDLCNEAVPCWIFYEDVELVTTDIR
jgi:hypothetical protein